MKQGHREAAQVRLAAAQQDLMSTSAGTPLCRSGDRGDTKYHEGRVTALRQALRVGATTGPALGRLIRQWQDDAGGRLKAADSGWRSYLEGGIHELQALAGETRPSQPAPVTGA